MTLDDADLRRICLNMAMSMGGMPRTMVIEFAQEMFDYIKTGKLPSHNPVDLSRFAYSAKRGEADYGM